MQTGVEVHAQFDDDLVEGVVLLLHLLVVAPALLCLPGLNEVGHALEDLVGPSEVLEDEVFVVNLEEPVIEFVFLSGPMSFLDIFGLFLSNLNFGVEAAFLGFLFVFFPGKADMALFPEERFKVVTWDDLLIAFEGLVGPMD